MLRAAAEVLCRWMLSKIPAEEDQPRCFRSLDLLLSVLPVSKQIENEEEGLRTIDATGTALEKLVRPIQGLDNKEEVVVKVILASREGYLCRSNILDMRMRHSELIEGVITFSTWDSYLPAFSAHDMSTLLSLLRYSPGAIIARQSEESRSNSFELLQKELGMRLAFDWILPTKPTARRVAVVAGRPMNEPKRGIYWSQGYFEAAQALGISIVVFDEPGHWLEGEEYAHLRDDFIAIDMSNIKELPRRLAEALKGRHIDGIVTFTDDYVIATAEAAEILGLPTEPAWAMRQAHYKYDMRKLVNKSNIQAVYVDSVEHLDDPATAEKLRNLVYPLIIKPCRGKLSKGVKKVIDDTSMRLAARALEEDGLTEHGILLETYVDGPEIDANFVLWDRQILFLEVNDNFPCLGDASNATPSDNFAETVAISNTGLPTEEVEIIRSSLHRQLLQLGFRSGVFHVEARMQYSSMRYQDIQEDGVLDLVVSNKNAGVTESSEHQPPDVFLVEVNARSPGAGCTWATQYTYGVDMGALQLLRAINDSERFVALSRPFTPLSANPGGGGGAQYWTAHSMVQMYREKTWVPENFFEKLYEISPEIRPNVSRAELYARPGTVLSPSGGIGQVGYLLLFSRNSRRHVLEMYYRVADAAKKLLDN